MSAKPSTVATWGGTILTPSAGKQAAGFVPSERPPAQYLDWLFNLAGQWQQYLSDGNLTGAFTFGSTVGITGLLTASAGITVPTGQAVTLQGTTTLTVGTGTTTLGGALAVTGAATLGSTLGVTGAATVGGTVGVTGVATFTGGLTTPSGWTLTGSAEEHHPARTMVIGAAGFTPMTGSSGSLLENVTTASPAATFSHVYRFGTSGDLVATVPLRAGDRITSILTTVCSPNTGSTNAITVSLSITNGFSSSSAAASGTSTGISSELQQFNVSPNYTLVAGDDATIEVQCNGSNVANSMHLVSVKITWDRP